MTKVNVLTADGLVDLHYTAAMGALTTADGRMEARDREALVALANSHIRLVEALLPLANRSLR